MYSSNFNLVNDQKQVAVNCKIFANHSYEKNQAEEVSYRYISGEKLSSQIYPSYEQGPNSSRETIPLRSSTQFTLLYKGKMSLDCHEFREKLHLIHPFYRMFTSFPYLSSSFMIIKYIIWIPKKAEKAEIIKYFEQTTRIGIMRQEQQSQNSYIHDVR